MQAASAMHLGAGDLAIGVEAGECCPDGQLVRHDFNFFFDAVAHDDLSAHATDQDRQRPIALQQAIFPRHLRGCFRTVNQFVGAGMHQFQISIGVDVAGQRQRSRGLIDAEDGAIDAERFLRFTQHLEWKQQAGCGKFLGILTEVALVDIQCALAIELKQHILIAARDFPRRAERHPTRE